MYHFRRRLLFPCLVVTLLGLGLTAAAPRAGDGPAPDFPRLPVCGDQGDTADPPRFGCAEFEFDDVVTYEVPGSAIVPLRFDFVLRLASYPNELGFFFVDDASGRIGEQQPGDPGYLATALERAIVLFPSGSNARSSDLIYSLEAGEILAFFIVQHDRLANLLAHNPENRLDAEPRAFFAIEALNPDGEAHFVAFQNPADGSAQFGFEDMTHGGDRDFDDVVFTVTPF